MRAADAIPAFDSGDDAVLGIYNDALMRLSAGAEKPLRLLAPDVSRHGVSHICGSSVTLDLSLDGAGRVTDFGFDVQACALTRAAVCVMRGAIAGKTRRDIAAVRERLESLLRGEDTVFDGSWAGLNVLRCACAYKARHAAILLPFATAEKAFLNAGF
jgi:NifU-like protein involved in Fe-S cluster formation